MVFRLPITSLLVFTLVVWRVTHLFWGEDGPFDIFVRLRRLLGQSFAGKLLDCFYCLSLWVAAPFSWWAGESWPERGMLWFAFSGGAILLERVTSQSSERRFLQNNHPPRAEAPWQFTLAKEGSGEPPPPAVWHEKPAEREVEPSLLQNNHPGSLRSHPSLSKEGSAEPAKEPQPRKGVNDGMLR